MLEKLLVFLSLTLIGIISLLPHPIFTAQWINIALFCMGFLLVLYFTCPRKQLFDIADWPLWLFTLTLSTGLVHATNFQVAWNIFIQMVPNTFLIFYIGKGIFLRPKTREASTVIICAFACLVAIIALLELYFGRNILYEHYIGNPFYARYISWRPMSTQSNPAVLGTYFLCTIPFALQLTQKRSGNIKILGWSSFTLSCIVSILTRSRGTFLGLITVLLFYAWNKGYKKMFTLIVSLVILIIALGSFQKENSLGRFGFKRFISGSNDSIISPYRMDRIAMSLRVVKQYPVFGIGYEHFRIRFNEYCEPDNCNISHEFKITDNMYLAFLSEGGIIGLLGFLIFSVFLFIRGVCALNSKTGTQQGWILAPLAAYVALLVNMGAYDLLYWPGVSTFFYLLCGFIQATKTS